MEICKEFRVEWESVVFFGMNENVGEERGEKEERAEEWWWRGEGEEEGVVGVVWWWCCVVLWCCGVCLCTAQQISIKGAYTARTLFVRSSLQNMAREEVAHHVVGDDSGMCKAGFAGDDASRAVPADAKHDGRYGPDGRKNLALHIQQRTQGCA